MIEASADSITKETVSDGGIQASDSPPVHDLPCGSTLSEGASPPPMPFPQLDTLDVPKLITGDVRPDISRVDKRFKEFWALHAVARTYEILAILFAGAAAATLVVFLVLRVRDLGGESISTAIITWLIQYSVTAFWVVLLVTGLYFIAQMIRVVLRIEQNTNETREACQELVRMRHEQAER